VIASQRSTNRALAGVSFPDLQDYRAATSEIFEDIAGYSVGFLGLSAERGRPERVLVTWVTGDYFQLLDLRPGLGRLIRAGEGGAGRADAGVVLGHSTWQRRFGSERSVIGRTTMINGRSFTIVGIAPPGFVGTFAFSESELYLPLDWSGLGGLESRQARGLHALARLRPGVTIERAQAAMNVVAERLARQYPDTNKDVALRVVPERFARPEEDGARSNALGAAIMLGLVSLVLIAAAVNVTNLLVARATGRRKEFAIRAALGAGRGGLVWQMLTESLILAALGGSGGVLLGAWTGRVLATIRLPGDLPVRLDFHLDWRVLAYAATVVVVTAVLVGLMPALRASRADLDPTLRESGRGSPAGIGRHRVGSALVVSQVAVCFVLLAAAGLFTRSLVEAQRVDLGFRPEGVLNVHMDVGQLDYTESRGRAFFDDVDERVRAIPGVEELSFAFTIPMGYIRAGQTLDVAGGPGAAPERVFAGKNIVGPRYFATMGIPVVRGRSFSDEDNERSHPVAIVNQRLADMLWADRNPIGRRFSSTGPDGPWVEVVGVTKTGKYRFLFEDPQPYFYVPISQEYTGLRVLQVRTSMSPDALVPAIERAIHEREPGLPLYDVHSMTRALGGGYGFFLVRVGAVSAAMFGLLGLALAVVGIYGVVSYTASQRTHEIGVRLALGASRRDILRLVLRDGVTLVISGSPLGCRLPWSVRDCWPASCSASPFGTRSRSLASRRSLARSR
jgi:predicted permease